MSTPHSRILYIIEDDRPRPLTFSVGSKLLFVVHVGLDTSPGPGAQGITHGQDHGRQNSDHLMAELEFQLGTAKTEYLRVELTYQHSSLPDPGPPATEVDEATTIDHKISTTAIASIRRCDLLSSWSPRPTTAPDPLLSIMEMHWGSCRTAEIMLSIGEKRWCAPGMDDLHHHMERLSECLVNESLSAGAVLDYESVIHHTPAAESCDAVSSSPPKSSPSSRQQRRPHIPDIPERAASLRRVVSSTASHATSIRCNFPHRSAPTTSKGKTFSPLQLPLQPRRLEREGSAGGFGSQGEDAPTTLPYSATCPSLRTQSQGHRRISSSGGKWSWPPTWW